MRHDGIMNRLVAEAKGGPNTLGFLLFGSVATGTHREDSDIDVVTVLRKSNPSSGISNAICDGIKVGEIFFAYQVLTASVETVPYLPHPLAHARLLFDRDKSIEPLL